MDKGVYRRRRILCYFCFSIITSTNEAEVVSSFCLSFMLPPPTRRRLCDRSVCRSINTMTHECGNGRRPNVADMGKR